MQDSFSAADGVGLPDVTERLISQIRPVCKEGRIELEEVSIVYDPVWKVQVTEQIHVNHQCAEETVYLIDFIPEQVQKVFAAEFICSPGQESL